MGRELGRGPEEINPNRKEDVSVKLLSEYEGIFGALTTRLLTGNLENYNKEIKGSDPRIVIVAETGAGWSRETRISKKFDGEVESVKVIFVADEKSGCFPTYFPIGLALVGDSTIIEPVKITVEVVGDKMHMDLVCSMSRAVVDKEDGKRSLVPSIGGSVFYKQAKEMNKFMRSVSVSDEGEITEYLLARRGRDRVERDVNGDVTFWDGEKMTRVGHDKVNIIHEKGINSGGLSGGGKNVDEVRKPGINPDEQTWAGFEDVLKKEFGLHGQQLGEETTKLLIGDFRKKPGYSLEVNEPKEFPGMTYIIEKGESKEERVEWIRTTQIVYEDEAYPLYKQGAIIVTYKERSKDPEKYATAGYKDLKINYAKDENYGLEIVTEVNLAGKVVNHSLHSTVKRAFLGEGGRESLVQNKDQFFARASTLEQFTQIIVVNRHRVMDGFFVDDVREELTAKTVAQKKFGHYQTTLVVQNPDGSIKKGSNVDMRKGFRLEFMPKMKEVVDKDGRSVETD